jgi:hypothetical protein
MSVAVNHSFVVTPFAQHMLPDPSVLEGRLTHFFATQRYPCRMISVSTRFTLDEPLATLRREIGALDTLAQELGAEAAAQLWRRRWLKEYRRLLAYLSERHLRRIRHSLLIWPDVGSDPAALLGLASAAFGTTLAPAPLAPPLRGRYLEQRDHLAPERPGQPYAALLTSYDLRGIWDLGTLHTLLHLDGDIALAVDSTPIGQGVAALRTDAAFRTQQAQVLDPSVKDVRAERALRDLEVAMHALDQQSLHRLSLTLLVMAPDRAALETRVQETHDALGTRLRLMRPAGGQAALLPIFSPTPTALIDAPLRPRTTLSHGIAVSVPFGFCRPESTAGVLWGIEQGSAAPVFFDPFAERQAAHLVAVGKTGSGKTFALMVWLLRLLLRGHQAVLIEPMGHARRLVNACGRGGAAYSVELGQPINVLDLAMPPGPGRLAAQIAHVRGQLGVLLGHAEPDADGAPRALPRLFSNFERAALEQALLALYGGVDPDTLRPRETPLLADLCNQLSRQRGQVARLLAEEIDGVLVSSSQGATFNAPTAIDWRFEADCTAYTFAAIPDELRPFYYGQALGALSRYVHDPRRRERKLIAAIDEFKYLSAVRSLESFAALAARTWRTRNAAIWTLDQTAHTYLGLPGHENPTGRSLIDNCPLRMIFRQDDASAAQVGEAIGLLTPAHIDAIRLADVGECVAVMRDSVFRLSVQTSDAEQRFFSGT